MVRNGLNVLVIVWSLLGVAQDLTAWKKYIVANVPNETLLKDEIFLIEATTQEVRDVYPESQILRSIDSQHHIIKGVFETKNHKIWAINDEWKLDVDDYSKTTFQVVISNQFDRSLLNTFQLVKGYEGRNTFLIKGRFSKIEKLLLHNPEVLHITDKVFKPFVESRVIDMNLNPNRVNKIHHFFPTLNGSTENVSIQENQFDVSDLDLLNRNLVSGLESEEVDNHATEMATIIAGAGNSFITGKGVAQSANLISSDFSDAMPDNDSDYTRLGINIQNHSYGIERVSEYGVEARAFDQSAYNNTNLLHVFSSGNQGEEISNDGAYNGVEGYANLTGNIKMSKNSLVVGSVDTVGSVPAFVSRGPTYDGRVKPEVVAYSVVGSSNSAALVSGVATLLQQQYREDHSVDMVSALVKAFLINGADDVGQEGLDFITGYGNVNAWKSLQALQNNQFYTSTVSNGEVASFELNIPSNAAKLSVTLCWVDPPANVNDFTALTNDLDLRLVNGAEVILPWVLDENPENLSKAAERGIDKLNNVEQVTIDNPELSYLVEIEGSSIVGSQEFYIAWQYELNDFFEWDFPTGSDNMPYNGETGSYFRWSTSKIGSATLSYSSDGVNWVVLDSNIDFEQGYWRWNNPPNLGDDVRVRIETSEEIFETESFTVSTPLPTTVGFNCGDSVMLKWASIPNAIDYSVFSMGDEILEEYQTTADTFLVIPDKNGFENPFFSIRPNLSGDKHLLPSPTFDYSIQGIECYIFSFFQTVALDTGIYLNLSLGTTYGIDRIELERNNLLEYDRIGTLTEFDSETILFLDENPNQGYNEHRVTIYFQNGQMITMSAGTSFYLTNEPLRIGPNPVQSGDELFIATKEFEENEPIFELVDHKGVVAFRQTLQGTQDFVPTRDLRAGIYFYRLIADGQVFTGRILVR